MADLQDIEARVQHGSMYEEAQGFQGARRVECHAQILLLDVCLQCWCPTCDLGLGAAGLLTYAIFCR